MAIYYYRQKYISAGQGQSAVAAAAYRHSSQMTVERNRTIADFSEKRDTVHSEIALPGDAPAWVRARLCVGDSPRGGTRSAPQPVLTGAVAVHASEVFWNLVEGNEKRADAQFARETVLALPVELTEQQNIALVRAFVAEHITSKGLVADWAFHLPRGGEHNPHVHLMTSLRPLTEEGFGAKTAVRRDPNGEIVRTRNGRICTEAWAGGKAELERWREGWAEEVNIALAQAGHDVRIDHRSLSDQGVHDVSPTLHRGPSEHIHRKGNEAELAIQDELARRDTFLRFEADPSLVLAHITRQQSTFDYRDIARTIHRYAGEGDDFDALRMRVGALPELVAIQAQVHDPETNRIVQRERFTTLAVLEREAGMVESARARALDTGFSPDEERSRVSLGAAETAQGFSYSPEQRAAIARLTSETGMAVMVGYAGAGKSTVMRAVAEVYEAEGVRVYGAALAGKAADALQHSSGIQSRTIASWERSWDNGNDHLFRGDVFVLDEAGMVASAQMARVLARLDQWGAKVILVGDGRQLQPIEAGAAFRAIAGEVGYVELGGVRRQRTAWQAEASVAFGRGDTRAAIGRYADEGMVAFHPDREGARQAVVVRWAADWQAGAETTMLAHTNRDVLALNDMARDLIKSGGGLEGGERFVTARGIREFAPGDRVIFLENDRSLGIRNGTIGEVVVVGKAQLRIRPGEQEQTILVAQENYNHIDHGYATTIHKAQGSTIDHVHVLATGSMDAQLTYVAMTRHREAVSMHVAMDSFGRPGAEQGPTRERVLDWLSVDRLKDTTLSFEATEDYRAATDVLTEQRIYEASLGGRLDAFLERRGLPHPRDVAESVGAYMEQFRSRMRGDHNGRVAGHARDGGDEKPVLLPEPDEALQGSLHRLDHVQRHSAAMGHEGNARRAAFHAAENELTRSLHAPQLRAYAAAIAEVVPPSTVIAIGRELTEAHVERYLADLSPVNLLALQENWTAVHAVSRASWELGLIETARSVDGAFRTERRDQRILAEYEAGLAALRDPSSANRDVKNAERAALPGIFIPAVDVWPTSVEAAVARQLNRDGALARFDGEGSKHAARIWRDPAAAWAQIRDSIRSQADGGRRIRDQIRSEPEAFGELRGSRTLMMRPNGDRQEALTALPVMASHAFYYASRRAILTDALHRGETEWRARMSTSIPELSGAALALIERLEAAEETERTHDAGRGTAAAPLDGQPTWGELKTWRQSVRDRLDDAHSLGDIPGLDPQRIAAIARMIERADRAYGIGQSLSAIERSRAPHQGHDLDRNDDFGRER